MYLLGVRGRSDVQNAHEKHEVSVNLAIEGENCHKRQTGETRDGSNPVRSIRKGAGTIGAARRIRRGAGTMYGVGNLRHKRLSGPLP